MPPTLHAAQGLADRLSGKILLAVEAHGEAWYINPDNHKRYFLGRPADAFQIMRELGLGISNNDFEIFMQNGAPKRLSGKIVLKVEDKGQAYYISPDNLAMHYLGRPHDAFGLMRELGLGISNSDLNNIVKFTKPENLLIGKKEIEDLTKDPFSIMKEIVPGINTDPFDFMKDKDADKEDEIADTHEDLDVDKDQTPDQTTQQATTTPDTQDQSEISIIEKNAFDKVNNYRKSINLNILDWNSDIADISRVHSQNMANESVAFGHDGFNERYEVIKTKVEIISAAENVGYNFGHDDQAAVAVDGWLNSPGHKTNIEGDYDITGMGVAKSESGTYYFTQIFAGLK